MLAGFYKSKQILAIETCVLTIFLLVLLKFFPGWLIYRYWVMLGGLIYVFLFVWTKSAKDIFEKVNSVKLF